MSIPFCNTSINRHRGVGMVEVLITIVIMTIGLLGMAALQITAVRGNQDGVQRSHATWLVQDLAERIRGNTTAYQDDMAGTARYVTSANAPDCTNRPATVCADYYNPLPSPGVKVNAVACTPAQMAAWDLWETSCPRPFNGFASGSPDYLNSGRVTSALVNGNYTLTVDWLCRNCENNGQRLSTSLLIRP
ncbi:hypothetical protein GCM10023116_18530 [Kistimonas scapharcae]|uniref:Type IV pilin Tt1218-like domain-containing protein n=1 Tax=Kistimonas scapharcae TaxID=1036133 RepID=A0ABP8V1Y6_9GAMM